MGMEQFENDVEMYGAQTVQYFSRRGTWFENDVEMYGAQTVAYGVCTYALV